MQTQVGWLEWVEWGLPGQYGIYSNITMPLQRAIRTIESNGVVVNKEVLYELDEEYRTAVEKLQVKFWKIAPGVEFTSAKQLREYLYDQLEMPVLRKTKSGYPSTDLLTLEKLMKKHRVVPVLYDLKKKLKIKKDFLGGWTSKSGKTSEGLLKWIRDDGRVHTVYRVDGTETGRLSGGDPNTMNISKAEDIRGMFQAQPGHAFIEADYSQLELRITAFLSQDRKMLAAFESGVDFHTATAMMMFNTEHPTEEQRKKAKTINFGILYGQGPYSLSFRLDIEIDEAEELISTWFSTYRNVHRWMRANEAFAKQHGYIDNKFGRRRHLPDLVNPNRLDPNWKKRYSHLLRVCNNFPVQSTGSDCLSLATIQLVSYPTAEFVATGARPIMSLHDAIFFEVPIEHAQKAAQIIKETMETIPKLVLGTRWILPVDVKVGHFWGDTSIYDPKTDTWNTETTKAA